MNFPKTEHKKLKYRNGETGRLITSDRKETVFQVLSLRDKHSSLIHHLHDGRCNIGTEDSAWDIVEVEE